MRWLQDGKFTLHSMCRQGNSNFIETTNNHHASGSHAMTVSHAIPLWICSFATNGRPLIAHLCFIKCNYAIPVVTTYLQSKCNSIKLSLRSTLTLILHVLAFSGAFLEYGSSGYECQKGRFSPPRLCWEKKAKIVVL